MVIKNELEQLTYQSEALDGLLLAMGEALFNGDFDPNDYELGFLHLVKMAQDISKKLNEIVELEYKGDVK